MRTCTALLTGLLAGTEYSAAEQAVIDDILAAEHVEFWNRIDWHTEMDEDLKA